MNRFPVLPNRPYPTTDLPSPSRAQLFSPQLIQMDATVGYDSPAPSVSGASSSLVAVHAFQSIYCINKLSPRFQIISTPTLFPEIAGGTSHLKRNEQKSSKNSFEIRSGSTISHCKRVGRRNSVLSTPPSPNKHPGIRATHHYWWRIHQSSINKIPVQECHKSFVDQLTISIPA